MASPKGISTYLEHLDSKKNILRRAILTLALEWKSLDEHLDSTKKCFDECVTDLNSKHKNLELNLESVAKSNRELCAVRESLDSRFQELECREEKFRSFQQTQIEDFKVKEEQLAAIRMWIEERMEQVELKEERLIAQKKSMEVLLEKIEMEKMEFLDIQKSVGQKLNEISLKEKNFEDRSKEIDSIQDWIERRARELDSTEEQVALREEQLKEMQKLNQERSEELDIVVRKLDSTKKLNEERGKELHIMTQEIDSARKLNEEWSEKLDSKEKQLNSVQTYINQCFDDFQSKNKQLKADQKLFEERCKELESKEKQLEEQAKDFESEEKELEELSEENLLKGKQFHNVLHSHVNVEQVEEMPVDIQVLVTTDGRGLQLYLNEHWKDHNLMYNEVSKILRLSSDPAKLVLDAMEGFYPPHLKKGDVEFKKHVVRKSCILLLEQLMIRSPKIRPNVREEALRLAGEWKVYMKVVRKKPLEVLAFIQLLASYKLASDFNAGEIFELVEFVAVRKQVPEICRALGLSEKVPDLVRSLIRKNQHLVAVKFIVACELVKEFPPEPLLRNYLWISKKLIKAKRCMENNSLDAQDKAIDGRIACMRSIINCIVNHKLECIEWCYDLEESIKQLQVRQGQRSNEPTVIVKNPAQKLNDNKFVSSITDPVHPKGSRYTLDPTVPVLACVLANMNGKNLQLFLRKHMEEHELMRKEVSVALDISFDSGKLVLDAIQGLYISLLVKTCIDIEASVIRTCIFLLEILMRHSQAIKPQVKVEARKLAVDWKANIVMHTTNPLVTLGFLLFVGTYKLTSEFDSNELLILYQTISKHRQAPELCHALGFSEEILESKNIENWEKIEQSAPEDLRWNDIVTSGTVNHLHSLWDEIPDSIRYASDPAKLVLDAVEGCYYSMWENRNISTVEVMKSFNFLLSRLLRISLEVKPQVKDQAMKVAADWKEKVKCRDSFEVRCFLLLLATYKVVSSCNTDELFGLLEIVYNHREAFDLFHSLGLADEVPYFVSRLIERGLHLVAIKYVYAFHLIDKFPPKTLLNGYISYTEEAAEKIRREGHYSLIAREIAAEKQVKALKAAMKCIRLHKLELLHPLGNLEARIEQLKRQKIDLCKFASSRAINFRTEKMQKKKRKGFIPIQPHAKKLCRAALSAEGTASYSKSTFHPFQSRQPPYPLPPDVFPVKPPPYLQPLGGDRCLGAPIPFPRTCA